MVLPKITVLRKLSLLAVDGDSGEHCACPGQCTVKTIFSIARIITLRTSQLHRTYPHLNRPAWIGEISQIWAGLGPGGHACVTGLPTSIRRRTPWTSSYQHNLQRGCLRSPSTRCVQWENTACG